jgi:hypothetical protein
MQTQNQKQTIVINLDKPVKNPAPREVFHYKNLNGLMITVKTKLKEELP